MTKTTLTKEELIAQRNLLHGKLSKGNYDEVLPQLKANEQAIKELDKIDLINRVNRKYDRIRTFAKQAYECEQPGEDITTNDGSFHKTKVKKYPKIAALEYARAKWEDNRITELTINGEKFYMYRTKYEYGKETEYTRPETFADFLALNSIMEKDITIEEYNTMTEKLTELNNQLKKDIDKYEQGLKLLNISKLNYYGLISQYNKNLYEYLPLIR